MPATSAVSFVQRLRPVNSAVYDESDPLLPEQQQSRIRHAARVSKSTYAKRLVVLLFICALERCVYYQSIADSIDPRPNDGNSSTFCGGVGEGVLIEILNNSWVDQLLRSAAYLLPIVGGYLADSLFGCVLMLRFSAILYVIGTDLLTMAVYISPWNLNPFCSRACKNTYLAILAVASGITRPCLLTLVYEAGLPLMEPLALSQLYYLGEAVGQMIGSSIGIGTDLASTPLTGGCMIATLLMLSLAVLPSYPERRGWQPYEFDWPGWPRISRLVVVFTPVVVLTVSNVFACFALNARGLAYFHANLTNEAVLSQRDYFKDSDIMLFVYSAALFISMVVLMLATRVLPLTRKPTVRIGTGLLLGMVNQAATCCVYFGLPYLMRHSPIKLWHLYIMFGLLNCIVAASEAFTFSTMNELALLMAPRESRTFTVGLIYSLWGTGFLFSIAAQALGYKVMAGNSASQLFDSTLPWISVGFGALLMGTFVYFIKQTPKAMQFLIDIEKKDRDRETEEIDELTLS